jgi:hypothetical protein
MAISIRKPSGASGGINEAAVQALLETEGYLPVFIRPNGSTTLPDYPALVFTESA